MIGVPGGLHESGWHHLSWDVEVFPEVLNASVSEEPVQVPPRVAARNVLLALKRLHCLDDMEVLHAINAWMHWQGMVLGSPQHALCRQLSDSAHYSKDMTGA